MTSKNACGDCGKDGGCGCQTANPYQESVRVVWHEPTDYDVLRHGPAFFPGRKLTASQRAEVRSFVRARPKQAREKVASARGLDSLLAVMRAVAMVHQTHHWMTNGQAFYADHLMFERLYDTMVEGIDQLAERIVGSGLGSVDLHSQFAAMDHTVTQFGSARSPDQMVDSAIGAEVYLLSILTEVRLGLESSGQLSPGTSNLLDGLYDQHESLLYLLKQRAVPYSYDRT